MSRGATPANDLISSLKRESSRKTRSLKSYSELAECGLRGHPRKLEPLDLLDAQGSGSVLRRVNERKILPGRKASERHVHYGNGTVTIFERDVSVFTFSIHQQHNYPLFKPQSDLVPETVRGIRRQIDRGRLGS